MSHSPLGHFILAMIPEDGHLNNDHMNLPLDQLEPILKSELSRRGYEYLRIRRRLSDGVFDVDARKLLPVAQAVHSGLHVRIPVILKLSLDEENNILGMEGGEPDSKSVVDAEHFVKTLVDNGQLDGIAGKTVASPSHEIIVNEQGKQVVSRKKFSAF